jgi:hypothetical protein
MYAIARRVEALTAPGHDTPGELCRIARECLELARAQPDEELVRLAATFAAKVRTEYPARATLPCSISSFTAPATSSMATNEQALFSKVRERPIWLTYLFAARWRK